MRIVLNEVESGSRLSAEVANGMARHFGTRLLGAVCRDPAVAEALAAQQLVADYALGSRAAEDLEDIAQAVLQALPASAAPAATGLPFWKVG
jgi:MinD-like ATPase involved in chromosome partitioning or flagellar assembly